MKLKVFRFRINNRTCSEIEDDKKMAWYRKESAELVSMENIEMIISNFLATHQIYDVQCIPVICRKNEDSYRDDDIDLIYNITYDDCDVVNSNLKVITTNKILENKDTNYNNENIRVMQNQYNNYQGDVPMMENSPNMENNYNNVPTTMNSPNDMGNNYNYNNVPTVINSPNDVGNNYNYNSSSTGMGMPNENMPMQEIVSQSNSGPYKPTMFRERKASNIYDNGNS